MNEKFVWKGNGPLAVPQKDWDTVLHTTITVTRSFRVLYDFQLYLNFSS